MSYQAGLAALNLEFTDKVPRTEYSANMHWELVKKVTQINTDILENRERASNEFVKVWDYDLWWNINVYKNFLGPKGRITKMGHAVYAESSTGESDYNDDITNPFEDIEDALNLNPFEEYGQFDQNELIKLFEKDYQSARSKYPNALNMGGVYVTLFSGLIEIFGWETLLIAMATDKERFGKVIEGYYRWVKQFFDAYANSNVPVIMSHDDLCWTSGPVAHPDWYRKYIFPHIKKLWEPIKEAGKKVIFTSDGDCTVFFDDIVACGADMVVLEPCADMKLFAEKYGKTHGFIGNADTSILLNGSKDDIYREVKRCIDIGKKYPGFIMAVGNHIPPNTPLENAIYYNEVYMELRNR